MSMSQEGLDQLGKFLVLPPSLRDTGVQRIYGWLIYAIVALIAGIVAWSALAQMRELAIAPGEIASASFVQPVHHLEGGILDEIYVSEGEKVTRGTPLLRLKPELAEADFQQLLSRQASLRLRRIGLTAAIEGAEPLFGEAAADYPDLAREQMALHQQTLSAWQSERQQLLFAIQQAEGALAAGRAQLKSAEVQIAIEREQTDIRERSYNEGHTSRLGYLEAQSRLEAANAKFASLKAEIQKLETAGEEARGALRKAEAERLQKLTDERAKVAGELSEVTNSLIKHQDRVNRLVVVSPTEGTINLLPHKSPGAVLKPGDLVAEIVSLDSGIIAEVQLKARDLGPVKVGDKAEVRVSNFDPSVMGLAHGEVIEISPTTFKQEHGEPYYRTRIKLKEDRLGNGEQISRLLPGMMIEAHIVTGSKTLFRYMLKPVYRSLEVAFSER
jgi:HlyD family secretion protein/adhesin transport system membrane fusion protein